MKTADLSPEMRAELDALNAMSDADIDTDDIPEAPLENMKHGFRGAQFKAVKMPVTIRLDTDVIAWFKENAHSGKYQSEINQVLRQHMNAKRQKSA